MTAVWLLLGVFLSGALIAYARTRRDGGRRVFALALIVAAVIYVGLALFGAGVYWLMIEVLGVLTFGSFVWLGFRHSVLWLAAGWALHPVWDVGLHLVGPGAAFTPEGLAIACISFDLLVAAYVFAWLRPWRVSAL